MALPQTDTFSGTAGNNIGTDSASWTNDEASFVYRSGGGAEVNGGTNCSMYWDDDVPNADQNVSIITPAVGSRGIGCLTRWASAGTYYRWWSSNGGSHNEYSNAGSNNVISTGNAWAGNSQVKKVTVIGSTISMYINGSLDTTIGGGDGIDTDANIGSGNFGLYGSGTNSTFTYCSSWTGDNEGAAAGQPIIRRFGGVNYMSRVLGAESLGVF